MEKATDQAEPIAGWPQLISGILLGWLVFLGVVFILLICVSSLLLRFDIKVIFGSGTFFVEILILGAIGLSAGVVSGRQFYKWLGRQRPTLVYLWLVFLLGLTLLSFPSRFGFVVN